MIRIIANDRTRLVPGVLIVVLSTLPSTAIARNDDNTEEVDTPGLTVEAVAGWQGRVDPSTPVPISFLLSNFSDQSVEGELLLIDDWNNHEVSLGDVFLTTGQTRRLSTVQSFVGFGRCFAVLQQRGEVLWRRELPVNMGEKFNDYTNYALIVHDSQRSLKFLQEEKPNEEPDKENAANQNSLQPASARMMDSLNATTWQIPTHVGPMMPLVAIVFPDRIEADRLNAGQWKAIAEWTCRGGTVFLRSEAKELRQEIAKAAPLMKEPTVMRGGLTTHPLGLGSIREFQRPLFTEISNPEEDQLRDIIGNLESHVQSPQIRLTNANDRDSGRANRSRTMILSFIGIYTVCSSLVTFGFARKKRKVIAVYTCSMVGVACIVSAVLGGSVRYSRGDVNWISVTQLTPGGAVQLAELEVQSAGGRSDRVSVTGQFPDVQSLSTQRQSYYGYMSQESGPAYTVRLNQAVDRPSGFESHVSITPWGRRKLIATDFRPDLGALDVDLRFEAATTGSSGGDSLGQFVAKIRNDSGLRIHNCSICVSVGVKQRVSDQELTQYRRYRWQMNSPESLNSYSYCVSTVGELPPDEPREVKFPAQFIRNNDYTSGVEGGFFQLQPPARPGSVRVWLISSAANSPSLQLDEPNSDFGVVNSVHYITQELAPERVPRNFVQLSRHLMKLPEQP